MLCLINITIHLFCRGERARFQLFGDTMNTCSRLESTGLPNRIHTSKQTANLLINAGKEAWLEKLETPSDLKGKGVVQTYFVNINGDRALTVMSSFEMNMNDPVELLKQSESDFYDDVPDVDDRTNRLINWNVEMLLQLMKLVAAANKTKDHPVETDSQAGELELRKHPLDEVREIIELPEFDKNCQTRAPEEICLPQKVVQQLHLLCFGKLPPPFANCQLHKRGMGLDPPFRDPHRLVTFCCSPFF